MAAWSEILQEAREAVGFTGRVVPRNLEGIRAALRPDRLPDLDAELATLSEGAAFEAFLDHWWTQSLADTATDADAKALAIDFADLVTALRAKATRGGAYTQAEVEDMLKGKAS
ncbi:hypothetical protein KUF83_09285 [Streptomyces sp. BV286]|uniref:hypothetical protein n=1 Tax=Streptomyces sp. BV286 TaxID=2849672 RepID=UPI001C2E507F|nr:hypothetical protein [Streptomyces sp. BV286]MBV1936753.1 hypothetical protein [Streptomyces sp. BV286]